MTFLLHAITRSAHAGAPHGLRGAPLEFIEAGGLGAWATRDSAASLTREDAFEHHRIVDAICSAQPCVPVRFGARVPDEVAARALVGERTEELIRTLERVGGRRELAVTLLWLDAAVQPGGGSAAGAATPGRAFLERKRRDHAAEEARRATAEALARRLDAELTTGRADVRHAVCPSSRVALSTAILAPPGRADALKEQVLKVVAGLDGVRGVVSGPWPPYTFAST